MKSVKKIVKIIPALLAAASLIALAACRQYSFYPDGLVAYELNGAVISQEQKEEITIGGATFQAMSFSDGDFSMKYRICVPESGAKSQNPLPVLLFFHGAGERGDDNCSQLSYAGLDYIFAEDSPSLNAIVIAPQCPENYKWVDVPSWSDCRYSTQKIAESKPLSSVLKILKYTTDIYNTDENRIYSMGMSMGGYATWDLLVRHGDFIAAAVPICGGCDVSKAELIKDITIYTFHGTADAVVPADGTVKMVSELERLNNDNIIYVEYEGSGHDIWNKALKTQGLMQWLFGQSLSKRP